MSRTIFNELGENRVINPRSGFSQFVDLSSNQIIGGIKRFLNNLITNSDVNFNTTANVGRIIFNPNEPAGSGSQIVSIYTEDENDGNSWIFDSDGNLYYLATGLQPIKIFFSATGEITSLGNINCGNILKTNTIQTNAPFGVIDVLSNIYLKASFFVQDPTNNGTRVFINPSSSAPGEVLFTLFKNNTGSNKSLNFNCDGSLYYNDGGSIWKFYENGNLITEGFLQSDKIQSNYFIGVRPFIKLDNRFIDTGNSSLDIITTYVGFPHPSQTLTTASKYMYIKPLSTGNFEMLISNIANKILSSDWATTKINSQYIWSINNIINQNAIILNGLTTGSGNRLEIFGTAGGVRKLYYNTDNELGVIETVTTFWKITGAGAITCASLNANSGIIQTTGSVLTNTINPVSGTTISTNSIWNFKTVGGTYTPILLDPTTTSGNRLKIDGTLGGTRYLFFNTSNNIGVFNTATSANVWSIDGTTGNINTIGTLTYSTLSATSLLTNSISPISPSTTININTTSNFNFLKSAGVNRIKMFPSSTTGDIMQITRTGDNLYGDGYWYWNNSGNNGYISSGIVRWELLNDGGMNLTNLVSSGYLRSNFLYAYTFSTYQNVIRMNQLFTNTSISSMSLCSQYIDFIHPSITPTIASKYMYIFPATDGNFTQYINNISAKVLHTDWASLVLKTDYNFQGFGKYIYSEHATTNDICGLWSNRTGVGGTVHQNLNSWSVVIGTECHTNGAIGGGGFNAGNIRRQFLWAIENTTGSGKALGLITNRTDNINGTINTSTQSTNYALLGYYASNRGGDYYGNAYSFTGEHSSMVCDEEYDDIMNYNTDDFLGMVVCSSGKIYNLPHGVNGNTYTKQVDNIKSVDSQPMTRLSKKYKDKSVLGVISHIEKVGKNRNDLNATSWTGCMALDNDKRRRIRVACIGEGGIWITNEYGNIENGDYITTSKIAGYATKQDDDIMHNYTIAKATMDCSFDIEKPDEYKTKYLGNNVYASYIAVTFHCG